MYGKQMLEIFGTIPEAVVDCDLRGKFGVV